MAQVGYGSLEPLRAISGVLGSGSLSSLTASADSTSASVGSAAGSLERLTASGAASAGSVASASVSLPTLTAAAYGPHHVSASLESLTASGVALPGTIAAGAVSLASLTAAVAAQGGTLATGSAALRSLALAGTGLPTTILVGAVSLRRLTARGTALAGGAAAGYPALRPLTASAASRADALANAAASLERLRAAGVSLPTLVDAHRTWVMNASSGALTEYQNYGFDSYAEFDGHHYGAGPGGLMRLDGADDAGSNIAWDVSTGLMDGTNASRSQRGGLSVAEAARLKRLDELLLAVRYDGPLRVRIWTDDEEFFDYSLPNMSPDAIRQVRVKLGKGRRSRYFRVQLFGVGNVDAELASMQLPLIPLNRRIG